MGKKITGYGAAGSEAVQKGFIHNFHHRQSHCFKRDKENLYSVDLDLYKAILGGDITIDIDGKVKLNVPGDSKWNQSKTEGERISCL
jgi:DnaJ-class molecular chaperone